MRLSILFFVCLLALVSARAADSGASVVIVYNSRMPESKQVAEYYAQQRQVPMTHVFGFGLPQTETMTRSEFIEGIQTPLLHQLETNQIFSFKALEKGRRQLVDAKIRYAVLCFGVPTRILRDTSLIEEGIDKLPPELQRNEASVDSQLACLPMVGLELPWTGFVRNPLYGVTNTSQLHPTNGVLLVTRLDGPSAAIARGLVDKAMEAETNGLWGRAYFDARGITNGGYQVGDDWIRDAAEFCRRMGFETELDNKPETFPASFPMSQIAIYAGWYDGEVSGPFTRPNVEFMPGAFAYHLHSFSASTVRSRTANWVGPLLAKGATITMGCVDEPYLDGTPDIAVFVSRWLYPGFSFGEAAWASQKVLSWQTIAAGDPLYRPFAQRPEIQHGELEARQSPRLDWSYLRAFNLRLAVDGNVDQVIGLIERLPLTSKSAVLEEKLADLYWSKKKFTATIQAYESVLKLSPTPQQKIRVLLNLGKRREFYGPDQATFNIYETFANEFSDHPDLLAVYQKLLPLAQKLGKKEAIERCQQEIKRLSPNPR